MFQFLGSDDNAEGQMVARKALGAQGKSFEMDIERGKIDEFARAINASHTRHYKGREVVIPATFLTTMFFWEKRIPGSNPWDLIEMSEERGMHAEQEYIFHGPPPKAGDRLVVSSTITELYDKERRTGGTLTFVKMTTEFRDPKTGHLRAEGILTGVERQ